MTQEEIRKKMLKHEINISKYASKEEDAIRLEEEKKDIRPEYFRDIDRIKSKPSRKCKVKK